MPEINRAAERAIEAAGGVTRLAEVLNVSPQVVVNWRRRGVPAKRVIEVEKASGISRSVLKPEIYPKERAA